MQRGMNEETALTSQAVGHPKNEITKNAFYQNLATRPEGEHFL